MAVSESLDKSLDRLKGDGYMVKIGWYPTKQRWHAWVRRVDVDPAEEVDHSCGTIAELINWLSATGRVGQ
jgi:hypothetical protein